MMEEQLDRLVLDVTILNWAKVFIGLLVIYVLTNFALRFVGRHVEDTGTRYRSRKFITFIAYVFGIAIVAAVFSNRLGQLVVAFGVIGAGIAFALQEVIASVAGWIAISFGRFFSPGDRIQLGGITGDVIDVGILRTTLMECGNWVKGDLYNGRIVRVANSFVFKEPVFNYSADFPFLWDEIVVKVKYGSDWEYAREKLRQIVMEVCRDYAVRSRDSWGEAIKKYRLEDANIDPMITLEATDNWIEFTARYVVDYRTRRRTRDQLFTKILQEVDRSNGRIRLASSTFELVGVPDFHISSNGKETKELGSSTTVRSIP